MRIRGQSAVEDAEVIDVSEPKPLALVEREVIETTLRKFRWPSTKDRRSIGYRAANAGDEAEEVAAGKIRGIAHILHWSAKVAGLVVD